jgi:hypothetical protein
MRVEPDSAPHQGHPRAGPQAVGLAMAFKQVYCVHRLVQVSASQCQHRSPVRLPLNVNMVAVRSEHDTRPPRETTRV